jgi:hypothetical protein
MMEWHLGKNASISVVKERHACVHALSASISVSVSVFITPYRKHEKRKRKRKVPIFGFDLHHT